MTSRHSAAVVEPYWRWLTAPAADQGRTPRNKRLSIDDYWDAIARLADWPRPKLAA
jgi:hypothetical protein